ncbi:MAG TPA: hypothetical protein VN328_10860 [Thermodesulfovibrionales bacterium]|nr:hypothetical protein [Thermodesulfovibrionales bacterium]
MNEETKLLELDLSIASLQVIELLILDAAGPEIFLEILSSNKNRPEVLKLLVDNPDVPPEVREEVWRHLNLPATQSEKPKQTREREERKFGLLQKIEKLTVGERISIALKGGQEIRSILLKDANKEVVLTVLKNPKITETEVELVAHSRNIPEDALRAIHKNREWMKNYAINMALVNNPKTPVGIAITLVTSLRTKDIAILEKNKNVSETVRSIAKKLLQARKVH